MLLQTVQPKVDLKLAAEIYRYGKGGISPDGFKATKLYEKLDEIESLDEVKTCEALFRIANINRRRNIYEHLTEIYSEGKAGLQPDSCKTIEYLLKVIDFERDKHGSNTFLKLIS